MTDNTQPEALRLAASLELCWGDSRIDAAASELRRLHARITELESQLAQHFDAADMATAAAQGFRDGVASVANQPSKDTNTAIGAADLALRLRNACTSVRSKSHPLADLTPLMQQAADALASTPAQPAAEASRFGSPELQAMIIARCVEKDQADSELEDACHAPPLGWRCTRKAGHEGPCAAVEYEDDKQFVERGMQRIRDAEDAARYRLLRRGQHWSVIDGIGNDLRAEALDAAVDAARKQGATQ